MMKKVMLLLFAVCFSVFSFAQDAAEKINQANEAMKSKDYSKAFSLYEDAMANLGDVQVPEAINYNIGLSAYNSKKYEKAIAYFDKAIAADANVAKAHDYKARSFSKLKDYTAATEAYEKAIAATDGDTKALVFNKGIAAYKGKIDEKAIEAFSKSVENEYKGATAQYYKARVLKRMGDKDAYKTALEEGVEKFSSDKKMTTALSKIYVSEGNKIYKKGAGVLSAANEKVNAGSLKTDDAAYITEVSKAKEIFASAIEILEKALKLNPSSKNATKLLEACKAVK